ncbi:helix-turn-helix transcriptional regulator [Sporosarcina siberiensis]|uniref:Helix-turn-helix transcriptional regulator n=1 Tax=Sporosarcina siberiensis TaxID=1365606 RepID=A0ABW4SKN4_9BACL
MENKIKSLRKIKKITQEELAKKCKVSRQTINAIENNKYDPSLVLAFDLATTLNTTVDELFIYEDRTL